ncbi:hypothetical protein GCM10018987_03710 [Streptomyces cremeus]
MPDTGSASARCPRRGPGSQASHPRSATAADLGSGAARPEAAVGGRSGGSRGGSQGPLARGSLESGRGGSGSVALSTAGAPGVESKWSSTVWPVGAGPVSGAASSYSRSHQSSSASVRRSPC